MNFVYFYDKTAKKGYNFVVSVQHAFTPFQLITVTMISMRHSNCSGWIIVVHQWCFQFLWWTVLAYKSSTTYSINFVHENNTRLMIPSIIKHLSDKSRRFTYVLVYNGTAHNLQKVCVQLTCYSSC